MERVIGSYGKPLTSRVTEQVTAEANLRFHDAMYRASRHGGCWDCGQDLRPQVYVFLLTRRYVRAHDFRMIMVENHPSVLDAIEQRDADAAAPANASYTRVLAAYEDGAAPAMSGAISGASPTGAGPAPPD